jgi:hypothetical protein
LPKVWRQERTSLPHFKPSSGWKEDRVLSTDADDEATNALMVDYIRAYKKLIWMYSLF